jgi:hypothetical protein
MPKYLCLTATFLNALILHCKQGWLFAMAKSIFAGTVEKTGKKKPAKTGKRGLCYWY